MGETLWIAQWTPTVAWHEGSLMSCSERDEHMTATAAIVSTIVHAEKMHQQIGGPLLQV